MAADTAITCGARIQELLCALASPRHDWAVVILLLGIHSGLLAYSAYVHSPTLNEPAHLAAGISHWQLGEFGLYRANPPLVRMVAALPVLATDVKTDWRRLNQEPAVRSDFVVGDDLIAANGERSFFLFMIARWACIPFAWIGGIVCYLWGRDLYGSLAGLLATTLWCFSPNILAHASLITPDAPATALYLAACYLFWRWLRNPVWEQVVLAGIVLGLAELTKTTFVFLYALLPLLWVLYRFSDRAKMSVRSWLRESAMLVVCLLIGIFVINLGYGFDGSFKRLGQFQFISNTLTGQKSGAVGNRFAGTCLGELPVPFPKDYVLGIDVQRCDLEHLGRPSYLAGEFKDTGWWYYYLYALAIKAPLGVWGLLLLTITLRFSGGKRGQSPFAGTARKVLRTNGDCPLFPPLRDELALLFPGVLILVIVSCQTGFNEHLRYVLPIAPFAFIWIGQIARLATVQSQLPSPVTREGLGVRAARTETPSRSLRERLVGGRDGWQSWRAVLAGGLLVWSIGSSLSVYPHSLSYFNELVGGPNGGPAHLLGSNADWGQDLRYLKWWVEKHPDATPLRLAYCGHCDPIYLGLKYTAPSPCTTKTGGAIELEPGWYAISVNFIRGYPCYASDGTGDIVFYHRNELSYFSRLHPEALAGLSIFIFHVEETCHVFS